MFFKRKKSCGRHFEILVLKSLLGRIRLQVPKPPIQKGLVTDVEMGHYPKSPQNPFLVTQMTSPDSMNITRSVSLMTLLVARLPNFRILPGDLLLRASGPSNSGPGDSPSTHLDPDFEKIPHFFEKKCNFFQPYGPLDRVPGAFYPGKTHFE